MACLLVPWPRVRRELLIVGTAWLILGILPAPGLAQQLMMGDSISSDTPAGREDGASSRETAGVADEMEAAPPRAASRRVLVPLYVSSAVLQMMDVHSTRRAMAFGHTEGNPLMSGIASNTTAFVAVKAATAAAAILVSEKLRRENRVAAIGLMIAVNAAAATMVAHNYRVAR